MLGNLLYTVAAPLPPGKAVRVTGGDPTKDGADGIVQSDIIREVNRDGEIVWEWRIAEARAERQGRTADLISRLDFLILDELGYLPFAQTVIPPQISGVHA